MFMRKYWDASIIEIGAEETTASGSLDDITDDFGHWEPDVIMTIRRHGFIKSAKIKCDLFDYRLTPVDGMLEAIGVGVYEIDVDILGVITSFMKKFMDYLDKTSR